MSSVRKKLAMKPTITSLIFTVTLTSRYRRLAEQFRSQQSNPEKGEQVYRNTLAVCAVDFYCQCMEIATDLSASDSWNPVMQSLTDVADLSVKNLGKLECCLVLPESQVVEIPTEALGKRIGYIAVQLDESYKEAKLMGFVKAPTTEKLPLSELDSLENFLEHIDQLTTPQSEQEPVLLSQWLSNIFGAGWETLSVLLDSQQAKLAYSFRNSQRIKKQMPEHSTLEVKRGKFVDLEKIDEPVALVLGLFPVVASPELDISVEVYPTGTQTHLPQDLQLMILDREGTAVMQAQARSTKNIQLEFSGEPGECFSVKVALGEVSKTETFII